MESLLGKLNRVLIGLRSGWVTVMDARELIAEIRMLESSGYTLSTAEEGSYAELLTQVHLRRVQEGIDRRADIARRDRQVEKEITITLEGWSREAIEGIFGSEEISNLRWDFSDDVSDVEYELILTLKRGPRKT